MKGPVYMRDREKQVLYVTDDGMRHWTSGSLTTTETDITVHSTLGSQTYHLFDHITVSKRTPKVQCGSNRTNNIDGAQAIRVFHNATLVTRMPLATIALLCK